MKAGVRKLILPWELSVVLLVISAVISGAQAGVRYVVTDWIKVSEGPCSIKSFTPEDGSIQANIDCEGKEGWTQDSKFIVGYLNNPRQFSCSLWASEKVVCRFKE